MPSALLIANPSASQFTGGVYREVVAALSRGYRLGTEWPISAHETEVVARHAAEAGVDVVFAMGGDGVAHHVGNALVGTDTALGLIPVGTTNVLARILGVPPKATRAATEAVSWHPVPTRTIAVVATTPLGELNRSALFSLGIGFDADVVETAEARPFAKTRFGSIHFARTALGRLVSNWRSRPPNLRMTCDGDRFDAVAALTQIHGTYTYFGKMPLRLDPDAQPGIVTMAADDLGIVKSAEIFSRAAVGLEHRSGAGIRLWSGYACLTVEAEPRTPFQADGELLGYADRLELRPAADDLLVVRPQLS